MTNDKITIFDKEVGLYFSAIGHYCINTYLCIQEIQKKCKQIAINIRQGFVSLRKWEPSK